MDAAVLSEEISCRFLSGNVPVCGGGPGAVSGCGGGIKLSWCLSNEPLLKKTFWKRMYRNESTQDFFGDWCSFHGYSDTGYFLGCRFVRYLLNIYTLKEDASLSKTDLMENFQKFWPN